MQNNQENQIKFIIKIIESIHNHQISQSNKKIENIKHLNFPSLIKRIENEIPVGNWEDNYEKIVSIIENILED